MRGDHFLPHHLNIDTITLAATDAPKWLGAFLKRVVSRDVLRCHFGRAKRGDPHEIYCDATGLLEEAEFKGSLEKILLQSTPATLKRIIHLDDSSSRLMADKANVFFKAIAGTSVPLLSFKELRGDIEAHALTEGTALVVSSCLASGRALMELSQILRSIQKNGSIVFLIGLTRAGTRQELSEIKSNITHTPLVARRFGFHRIEEIFPPDYSSSRRSIWGGEVDFLQRLLSEFLEEKPELRPIIEKRIEQIRGVQGISKGGMRNELFWTSSSGTPLSLRSNFAFFPFNYEAHKVTQSEVYFTIASVLHSLRRSDGKRTLRQYEYHRILIHPHTFYRLNDGVVQAALLRAALPGEMNFTLSPEFSGEMAEVLRFVFTQINTERGEAAREFALALAMGQMRLFNSDIKAVATVLLENAGSGVLETCLARYIQSRVNEL
jgi:hypothetical protein